MRPAFAGEGGSLPLSHRAATFPAHPSGGQASALGAGGCQSFACALGDQVSLDLGEQAEQGNITLVCRSCSVATALHQRYPDKAIVIAGDDDHGIENNPGREKALVAAEAVAGVAIFPNFSAEQRGKGLTDFNDLAIQNPELVSRQLDDVLHGVKEQGLAASQSIELASAV